MHFTYVLIETVSNYFSVNLFCEVKTVKYKMQAQDKTQVNVSKTK